MPGTLKINARDIKSFPKFKPEGWDWRLDTQIIHGKCFAWIMDDADITNPAAMKERFAGHFAAASAITEPPEYDYGDHDPNGKMRAFALEKWQEIAKGGNMIPVAPDKDGTLDVPEGMYPVFMTVWRKRDGSFGTHWYRADRPDPGNSVAEIGWSHWDGEGSPSKYHVMTKIIDPAVDCTGRRTKPVGYFLVPAKPDCNSFKACGKIQNPGSTVPETSTGHRSPTSTPPAPAMTGP